jgi:hypothetical protein
MEALIRYVLVGKVVEMRINVCGWGNISECKACGWIP